MEAGMEWGIITNDDEKRGELSVERRSDRIIWVKVAITGEIINIMSAYASHTGCGENEKIKLCEEMEDELRGLRWTLCKEYNSRKEISSEIRVGESRDILWILQ